ncbi:M20 family metallopeptidase [Halomicrobium salinisoli]|uniref:M20 family metallopeptidase n=1 Tax=Halomicrobium salinisoli TaxID=2878391 RepID=UPI001CEFB760|nr:M20 family metallopeptidase [Halomicrobium salinisoli]
MTDFDLEAFHRKAVETPSHESVDEMRDLLVETLADHGVEATVDDHGNTVASRGGDGDGTDEGGDSDEPHYVLNTHVDTVPPHVEYRREGDRVYGRGSCDAKGPLAAMVDAFLRADVEEGGRVTLAITPNEETVQTGAAALAEDLTADGYIVGEPTGLDVCTAASGQCEGTVVIQGESAHAADPGSGKNAIRAAAPVLQALETYDEKRGPGEHEQLGRPTLTATMIEGGEATNQVPAECRVTFDRRSVPPETVDEFRADLEEHLYQWMPTGMDLSVELIRPDTPFPEAFATDEDADLVRALRDASGGAVRPFGAATEASYFAADAPTVVFGPGVLTDDEGAVAHSEREHVPVGQLHAAADAIAATLDELL